jgi:hypothetical protein
MEFCGRGLSGRPYACLRPLKGKDTLHICDTYKLPKKEGGGGDVSVRLIDQYKIAFLVYTWTYASLSLFSLSHFLTSS